MNRYSFLRAAPIRDAYFGDDITAGPGDALPLVLPRLPGKQVSRNPSPLLRKHVPLTQGTGSGQEGAPADGVAPLCATAGVSVCPKPPQTTPNAPESRAAAEPSPLRSPQPRRPPAARPAQPAQRLPRNSWQPHPPADSLPGNAARPSRGSRSCAAPGGWRGTGVQVVQERVPVNPQTQGTPQDRGTALLACLHGPDSAGAAAAPRPLISTAHKGPGRARLGPPHDLLRGCRQVASKAPLPGGAMALWVLVG